MKLVAILLLVFSSAVAAETGPLADNKITCDEMEKYPEVVFGSVDLGSGRGSPNKVDFDCPKSLSQLEFLKPIVSRAASIRSPFQLPQYCTGSIVYAQWRYYHLDLAMLGYYPQGFDPKVSKTEGPAYFEEWSYQSLHNREIYEGYWSELENVRPLLKRWYQQNHSVGDATAEKYTEQALSRISGYGFGSYYYYWEPEALVPHTSDALAGNYHPFLASLSAATDAQKMNSLRRALVHSLPEELIKELVASISKTWIEQRSESPISVAVTNPSYVEILLNAGFDPNHQNNFGKTPLYYAIEFSDHESVRRLLKAGADVNHGYQLERENRFNCIGIKQWGRTPLMHAAQHSDVSMLKLLLQSGADPSSKDSLGSTVMDYADKNDDPQIVDFLISELGPMPQT